MWEFIEEDVDVESRLRVPWRIANPRYWSASIPFPAVRSILVAVTGPLSTSGYDPSRQDGWA